ncbi:MAG: HIT family protein [archaeon]|jgi:histidine triad (HIT) family protein|nr:HIT family protein [archaeon]MDA1167506.1 HIT family protein [archaeon]
MADQTLFERIINGEIPCHKVAEGEHWFSFLDIFPRREGHTLVIPKRAVSHLGMLSDTESAGLMQGVKQVQQLLAGYFGTSDFTVCLHDGPNAGQEVPHVHVHILPRTVGDGGSTLAAMWPQTPTSSEIDHAGLGALASALRGE